VLAFGPWVPQVGPISPSGKVVEYGVIEDLREALEIDGDKIAAFMIEPIQGAAGYVQSTIGLPSFFTETSFAALFLHQRVT
jgi:acetylornithine/succinyldiaminopimelate/putrescine aminotransferase